jgi:hypothetical protein
MPSQTLIFVVLPNGFTPRKTLSVSVYMTPRLQAGATLAAFPDILNWAELVQNQGLKFEFKCGVKTHTLPVDQSILRPDVWQQIFKPSAYVEAYKVPDFDQRLIVSYPVRDATAFLKYAYQAVGSGGVSSTNERGGLRILLRDLTFRDGAKSTLAASISAKRLEMWTEQRRYLMAGLANQVPASPAAFALSPSVPPDGVSTPLTPAASTRDTMTRFALFHHMPPAPNRPPLPQTEADFAKTLDFHRALTALNSYPWLLRVLGLVFDLELQADFCPASPAAGAYGSLEIAKVTAGFTWSLTPTFCFPVTSYVRDKKSFQPAPATPATAIGGTEYVSADVAQGFLALTPENFHLLAVDLDGALLKALALADNAENSRDQTVVGDDLPALRSSGVGLVADARGIQLLQSISDNKGFDQALSAHTVLPRPLNARDLLRGFRLDIWSSTTQEWRSLHQRTGIYRFGASGEIEVNEPLDEGFLQPTAAQPADDPTRKPDPVSTAAGVPQPGSDLYAHERIARWEGWSLSAPRPGKALNRSPDPGQALVSDPTVGQPLTPFKMTSTFAVVAGSLPQLRFGTHYRVRARFVDLAGNSVPIDTPTPAQLSLPANGTALPYLRFDPVTPPLVVLQQPTQQGATLERMVIRSWNSNATLDGLATTDTDHRHIAPPRVGQRMAEQHAMFDDASGKLRGDGATYSEIVQRDEYTVPTDGGVLLDASAQLYIGYLPDPIARGAALRNLPSAPDNANGRIDAGSLSYSLLPDVQPRSGSVTYIPFGTQWPEREAFLLSLVEGASIPAWSDPNRELAISLSKGLSVSVDLSSYITESDLLLMGIWAWLREYFEARELASMQGGTAEYAVGSTSDLIALLTRLILEGGHALITPARTLTLVHAVQQPLGHPQFVQLPVVHRPSDPIFASALRNSFTLITAWRSYGSHSAVLFGALEINGNSTSKVDLESRWQEYTDDPLQPAPTVAWNSAHVETIPLPTVDPGPLYSDGTNTRMVAVYIPRVDALWFAAPFDELQGVFTPGDVAAPLHRFDDTKHRWVGYTAVSNSRFEEYFPTGLDFTRSSDPLLVDVPSSARPLAPDIAYVVPTFGWEQQETTNVKSAVRFGNGLRVYLNRPWYSSGQDELLGVVLWNGAAPDYPTSKENQHLFTQWGNDPIWKSGYLGGVPTVYDFSGALTTAAKLTVAETSRPFDVAGHTVQFDPRRKLWFCDIQFYNTQSYMPFVRMALARYQPHSISGVELSRIVLADFAQLTPDRSAVISIDPGDPRQAKVFVGGLAPQPPAQSVIEVTVQRRIANMVSDLAWEVAPTKVVKVTENAPDATEPDAVLWSGSVVFAKTPAPDQFRIVVREFERIQIDSTGLVPVLGERLVYVAIVDYAVPPAE